MRSWRWGSAARCVVRASYMSYRPAVRDAHRGSCLAQCPALCSGKSFAVRPVVRFSRPRFPKRLASSNTVQGPGRVRGRALLSGPPLIAARLSRHGRGADAWMRRSGIRARRLARLWGYVVFVDLEEVGRPGAGEGIFQDDTSVCIVSLLKDNQQILAEALPKACRGPRNAPACSPRPSPSRWVSTPSFCMTPAAVMRETTARRS